MVRQGQSNSPQRLHHVEQRIVWVVELAGVVMEELGSSQGLLTDGISGHCREFMLSMKEIQTTLHDEIKSACGYRPFEKRDYSARVANEICLKKLEYVNEKMDAMQLNIEQSTKGLFVWAAAVEKQLWKISCGKSAVQSSWWKQRFGVWQECF